MAWKFHPADELELRRLAQWLQSRLPEQFSMQSVESLVPLLKNVFVTHCDNMRRRDAFKLVCRIVCIAAEQQQIQAPPSAVVTYVGAENSHEKAEICVQHTTSTAPFITCPSSSPLLEDDDPPPEELLVNKTEPNLCKEQQDLVDLILRGHNVFYTGSAGCGKSTVLRIFVQRLKDMGKRVKIVAPTGRAALDINGITTWTFAGWTPNHFKKPISELEDDAHQKVVWKRLTSVDVLVIDEISMVENLHLERLNRVMKAARNNPKAFGGVQLIVTGDFCQLPPVKPFQFCMECGRELIVVKTGLVYECPDHGKFHDEDKWAFCSAAWREADLKHVQFNEIHRQSDEVFIRILQKLRVGYQLTSKDEDILLNHRSDTTNAVRLFSTHDEVKRVNDAEYARLQHEELVFKCWDYFEWNEEHDRLRKFGQRQPDGSLYELRDHRFDKEVRLKKETLVVLLANLDIGLGLVNGSQGKVVGFQRWCDYYRPKAMSTLRLEEGKGSAPPGVPTLSGEYATLREIQIQEFITKAQVQKWPVVRFANGIIRTIFAECRVNELGDEKPYSLLMRTQIPLIPAWAMTIHKSQGMTLDKVVVNLSKSFESGQGYVALSRARSLDGLKVESLGKGMPSGDEKVRAFLADKFGT